MQNYIFSNLTEADISILIDAMEILDVSRGEHVISQGINMQSHFGELSIDNFSICQ